MSRREGETISARPQVGKVSATWVNPLDPGPSNTPPPPKPPTRGADEPVAKRARRSASPPYERDRHKPLESSRDTQEGGRLLERPRYSQGRSPRSPRHSDKRSYDDMQHGSRPRRHPQDHSSWETGQYDRYQPSASGSSGRDNGYHSSGGSRVRDDRTHNGSSWDDPRSSRYGDYYHSSYRRSGDRRDYDSYSRSSGAPRPRDDHYEPGAWDDEREERRYTPRSPQGERRHRRRTPSPTRIRSPTRRIEDTEDGEIAEHEEEEVQPVQMGLRGPIRTGSTTAPSSQQASENGSSYQPIKIKNRPTKRSSDVSIPVLKDESTNGTTRSGTPTPSMPPPPPPPPTDDRPPTPPELPTPPPPSDKPPTPPSDATRETTESTPTVPSSSAVPARPPQNRVLELTKSQAKYDEHGDRVDGRTSAPHAPNRNLLNPTTRPSTPAAKGDATPKTDTPSKTFRIPTAAQEMDSLQKTFFGTTTLAAYDLGDKLGEGTFGVVTKGIEIATKKAIALKKLITHNPRDGVSVTTVREIKILKSLNHPNIVEIMDMVVQRKNPLDRTHRGDVFMVFPYMDHDLCGLLTNGDFKMTHSVAKLLMRQILEGMDYIHANNFIHRDIKTANILVDREGGIKIADFGLARTWTFDELMPKHLATEYTNMVVTRWYRAPELLLGDRHYGPAVDMWSLGCVLGEMYNRSPVLQGETDRDQLFKIFGRVGRPNDESFPGWNKLPGFPESVGYAWDKVPEDKSMMNSARGWGMDHGGADLMLQLLRLDPVRRLSANDALDHSWFWCSPKPAVKAKNLITVESSHEMTQRIRNASPPMINRPRPQRPPVQRPPPVWNNGPPRHVNPMNMGMNGGPPMHGHHQSQNQNPYAGAPHTNPYGGPRPPPQPFNNGPSMAVYPNGHGHGPPHTFHSPGMNGPAGPGPGGPNPYAGGPAGLPPRPPAGPGFHSRPPSLQQAFGPGTGAAMGGGQSRPQGSRSHAPPAPSGFLRGGPPRRPPGPMDARHDAGAARQDGLPYS